MRNPWLDIPLDDYESHMSLPGVGQAQMIETLLQVAADLGFAAIDSTIIELSSGKRFCVQNFRV